MSAPRQRHRSATLRRHPSAPMRHSLSARLLRPRTVPLRHPHGVTSPARLSRPGMTLVEMIFALSILTIVLVGALTFLQGQVRAFAIGNDRMARLQTYRFAANTLEQHLRTMGAGVPGHQPFLIYAGDDVVAFNADYLSHTPGDPSAIYIDTDAPPTMTSALTQADRLQLPGTNFFYPNITYFASGTNSPAETIIFYFERDQAAEPDTVYTLFRQVNAFEPEVVARNLRRSGDAPFFTYLRPVTSGNTSQLAPIQADDLPLQHSIDIHQAAGDTGRFAIIDQIRGIRLTFAATSERPGTGRGESVISRVVHLPNVGIPTTRTCGAAPIMGERPEARVEQDPDTGEPLVVVSWGQAVDEREGERDVVRYVVWRRIRFTSDWGEPIESLRSGEDEYSITDNKNLIPGESYEYGVGAQDCTPMLSSIAESNAVTIPSP